MKSVTGMESDGGVISVKVTFEQTAGRRESESSEGGRKWTEKRGGTPHQQANGKPKFCCPCIAESLGQHSISLKQGQENLHT